MFGNIVNRHGENLDYTYHPGRPDAAALVLLGHGVTGNKDRPFLVALAEGLAAAGVPALRFSFSGNGASGGRFVDSTISKEADDLGSVIDAVGARPLAYVGHSMGGAVGVIRASHDQRINYLVSLAGMVHTRAFMEREFGNVKPGEGVMWDDPNCPLSQAYVDNLRRLDSLADRAEKVRVPWLLVHGTEDDVVPPQDSRDIFALANAPKELHELPGANHVFTGPHTPVLVEKVVAWLTPRLA